MAYSTETGLWTTFTLAFMTQLKNFMVSVGWDVFEDRTGDTVPAFIMHSTGEDGTEEIYMRIIKEVAGTNALSVYSVRYWTTGAAPDAAKLFQMMPVTIGYSILVSDSANVQYWMYGDKNKIIVITRPVAAATYYLCYFGLITSAYTRFHTHTTQARSTGDTVIQVVDASQFVAGQYYEIASLNSAVLNTGGSADTSEPVTRGNFEQVKVASVNNTGSVDSITLEAPGLVHNQSNGAAIGTDIRPVLTNLGTAGGVTGHMINGLGANTTPSGLIGFILTNTNVTTTDPSIRERKFWLWPIEITCAVSAASEYRGIMTDVYALGSTPISGLPQIVTGDTVTVGAVVYRIFILTVGGSAVAIREP
jgi:hypothetical protein